MRLEESMLRGVWEHLVDAAADHDCLTAMTLEPSVQPGRFNLHAVAYRQAADGRKRMVHKYITAHPSSEAQSLAGALMRACIHLTRMFPAGVADDPMPTP
jgi:hypothetical protein